MNDLKLIIAYFSVSHISLILISFFLMNKHRNYSIIIIILSHSISSPLLFFFVSILYLDFSSRIINKIGRIFFKNKIFIWLLFLTLLLNISLPPTINFFREIYIFFMILNFNFILFWLILFLILISGLISIFIIIKILGFKENNINYNFSINFSFSLIYFMILFLILIIIINLKNF